MPKYIFVESCYTYKYQGRSLAFKQDPLNMWFPYTPPDYADYDEDNTTSNTNVTVNGYETSSKDDGKSGTTETSNTNNTQSNDLEPNDEQAESNDKKVLTRRFFYVYYTTADTTEISSDILVDFATFIGSIGGNLGLFLGFSFLGMSLPFYDKVEGLYRKWKKRTSKVEEEN